MFSYGGGYGYRAKRSRRDTQMCEECGDEFDMEADDWGVCGDCQHSMCSVCMQQSCNYCSELHAKGEYCALVHSGSICESCMTSCDDCEDACFHKNCLVEHLKPCNKKSRAQRTLASAKKHREQVESQLASARRQLVAAQQNVERLERDLARSRKDESKAERELKAEVKAERVEKKVEVSLHAHIDR